MRGRGEGGGVQSGEEEEEEWAAAGPIGGQYNNFCNCFFIFFFLFLFEFADWITGVVEIVILLVEWSISAYFSSLSNPNSVIEVKGVNGLSEGNDVDNEDKVEASGGEGFETGIEEEEEEEEEEDEEGRGGETLSAMIICDFDFNFFLFVINVKSLSWIWFIWCWL